VPVIGGWAEAIPAAADKKPTADTSRRTIAPLNVSSLVGRGQPHPPHRLTASSKRRSPPPGQPPAIGCYERQERSSKRTAAYPTRQGPPRHPRAHRQSRGARTTDRSSPLPHSQHDRRGGYPNEERASGRARLAKTLAQPSKHARAQRTRKGTVSRAFLSGVVRGLGCRLLRRQALADEALGLAGRSRV
jgi:hypothetical protein